MPNLDVNHTRCVIADERWQATRATAKEELRAQTASTGWPPRAMGPQAERASAGVAYDVSKVPGASR